MACREHKPALVPSPAALGLKRDLGQWLGRAEGERPPSGAIDPRDLEALRAMGYVE